jgi:hypothetical protein
VRSISFLPFFGGVRVDFFSAFTLRSSLVVGCQPQVVQIRHWLRASKTLAEVVFKMRRCVHMVCRWS